MPDLAKNPDVRAFDRSVRNKSIDELSQADTAHFQQYFKGKNLKALFEQKDKLENLVKGVR
jgi:hypothetical protein